MSDDLSEYRALAMERNPWLTLCRGDALTVDARTDEPMGVSKVPSSDVVRLFAQRLIVDLAYCTARGGRHNDVVREWLGLLDQDLHALTSILANALINTVAFYMESEDAELLRATALDLWMRHPLDEGSAD